MNHNIKVLPPLLTGYGRMSLSLIWPGCVDVWHQSNCTQWRFLRASAGKDVYTALPAFGSSRVGLQDLIQTENWRTALTFIKRLGTSEPSCTNSCPHGNLSWKVSLHFHHVFFFNFYFWFTLCDQYLILQGKYRRRLMFQYVRLLEPPARGENAIPEGTLKILPYQGHPENICGGSTGSARRYHVS